MRMAMIVEYDGTEYSGFQYQKNARTIQEEIEKAIESLTAEAVRIKAAGRTDAGVHALGQVVAFDTEAPYDPRNRSEGAERKAPTGHSREIGPQSESGVRSPSRRCQ